jgi:hypothetical protein
MNLDDDRRSAGAAPRSAHEILRAAGVSEADIANLATLRRLHPKRQIAFQLNGRSSIGT